jgi:hypothetical protein
MLYTYDAFRLMHEDFVTVPPTTTRGRVRRPRSAQVPAGPTHRPRRRRRR